MRRLIDVISAVLLGLILSPLLLVVPFVIRLLMGKPVLFRQDRIGLNEEPFTLYKFRTMRPAGLEQLTSSSDKERTTRLGQLLRLMSIDELPSLFNLLRGDISLIGPRPLPTDYLRYLSTEERRRFSVKPGITGLAQVNGRNSLSWSEKFFYDIQYIESRTFLADFRIILKTVGAVLNRNGVDAGDGLTMTDLRTERAGSERR